jgi:hypothetical protein
MKKGWLFSGIILLLSVLACNNDKKENSETQESVPEQTTALPEITNSDPVQPDQGTQTIELPSGPQAPTAGPAVQASTAAGLNPPHGEPGHRCDIDVGAPLNSPPGNAKTSAPVTIDASQGIKSQQVPVPAAPASGQTQQIQVAPPAVTTPTAPGMNPPHGEPGHVCGIPVGSPLKK